MPPTSALLLVLLIAAACSPGDDAEDPAADPGLERAQQEAREQLAGRWKPARWELRGDTLDEKIANLEAIGYAGGTQLAGDQMNVTVNEAGRVEPGYNLYVSGHAPEAVLIDMAGKELHRWRYPYSKAVPDNKVGELERALYRDFWRRAHLDENGDLLAIFEGHALIKLDAASNLLWVYRGKPHHDLEVMEDGSIYVLTRRAHVLPRINPDEPVLEDTISVLDADGNEVKKVSVLEAFERSEYRFFLKRMQTEGDILHTNTLEVVDERLAGTIPGVEAGHVLISCLFLDTIAIVDMDEEKVVWAKASSWKWQHQPTVLDDGKMLLFDNLGGDDANGRSRVIEFDPVSMDFEWLYEGTEGSPFHTSTCGSAQRLGNGNTLITESDNGRAFEVDRAGEIVWEFLNPYRAGPDDSLVATLFEIVRLPPDFPLDWAGTDD